VFDTLGARLRGNASEQAALAVLDVLNRRNPDKAAS